MFLLRLFCEVHVFIINLLRVSTNWEEHACLDESKQSS
jgi:hypothetical protein